MANSSLTLRLGHCERPPKDGFGVIQLVHRDEQSGEVFQRAMKDLEFRFLAVCRFLLDLGERLAHDGLGIRVSAPIPIDRDQSAPHGVDRAHAFHASGRTHLHHAFIDGLGFRIAPFRPSAAPARPAGREPSARTGSDRACPESPTAP